jgi:Cytochrome oxidase complex assembly protein 1
MDQPAPQNWWGRNWKWLIPVGCLVSIIVCVSFVVLLVVVIVGAIKGSDAYTEGLARARASAEVKKLLGEPIEPGFWTGKIKTSGPSGNADFAIPLSGPKGTATRYVVATKTAGKWDYSVLEVAPETGGPRIKLFAPPALPEKQ